MHANSGGYYNNSRRPDGLLWKDVNLRLPESRINAQRQLMCIERKMDRHKAFVTGYCDKIDDYLAKGYCRQLTEISGIKCRPEEEQIQTLKYIMGSQAFELFRTFDFRPAHEKKYDSVLKKFIISL
ncbi:unnamed protein product [Allacma fusca]|uniref:Uncharacterized protein n=1 Tax=Allacma fusca TaxID=39272 RepID=A0A8J2KLY0_9HEXA|nr:unnamed protein product [Allacma fusca]